MRSFTLIILLAFAIQAYAKDDEGGRRRKEKRKKEDDGKEEGEPEKKKEKIEEKKEAAEDEDDELDKMLQEARQKFKEELQTNLEKARAAAEATGNEKEKEAIVKVLLGQVEDRALATEASARAANKLKNEAIEAAEAAKKLLAATTRRRKALDKPAEHVAAAEAAVKEAEQHHTEAKETFTALKELAGGADEKEQKEEQKEEKKEKKDSGSRRRKASASIEDDDAVEMFAQTDPNIVSISAAVLVSLSVGSAVIFFMLCFRRDTFTEGAEPLLEAQ